jgi:hypothetical protein
MLGLVAASFGDPLTLLVREVAPRGDFVAGAMAPRAPILAVELALADAR